jgi:hypothetical protein
MVKSMSYKHGLARIEVTNFDHRGIIKKYNRKFYQNKVLEKLPIKLIKL